MNENPNNIVAEAIKKVFMDAKLLKTSDLNIIIEKLSGGNITEEDWKLMAELSLEKQGVEKNAKEN